MISPKKIEKAIRSCFDDVDTLDIEVDDEGLKIVKCRATLNDVFYKTTIHRNSKKGKPLYTGTISLLDPEKMCVMVSESRRRAREAKGKPYKEKDIYATITYHCNSKNPDRIIEILNRQMTTLLQNNQEQYSELIFHLMPPDRTTPRMAIAKNLDAFLESEYGSSPPESNRSRKNLIKKTLKEYSDTPFAKIKQNDVDAKLKNGDFTWRGVELCDDFWSFLFRIGRVSGKSPFHCEDKSSDSAEETDFRQSEISDKVFSELFRLINKEYSNINCVLVLLISGFTWPQIKLLKWCDIKFVSGYTDFAIVHMIKDNTVTEKHDYSRPVIPDTAKYLFSCYKDFSNRHGEDNVLGSYIARNDITTNAIFDRSDVAEAANNILVRAGYSESLRTPGRPGIKDPAAISLLTTNYRRMLNFKAGLKDDTDTYHFLAGTQCKSSTFINYESHTSPEQQYRLYTILKPLSVEEKIRKPKELKSTEDGLLYTAAPKNNHEVAQVSGTITLAPGQSMTIRCPHGVTGRISKI